MRCERARSPRQPSLLGPVLYNAATAHAATEALHSAQELCAEAVRVMQGDPQLSEMHATATRLLHTLQQAYVCFRSHCFPAVVVLFISFRR